MYYTNISEVVESKKYKFLFGKIYFLLVNFLKNYSKSIDKNFRVA